VTARTLRVSCCCKSRSRPGTTAPDLVANEANNTIKGNNGAEHHEGRPDTDCGTMIGLDILTRNGAAIGSQRHSHGGRRLARAPHSPFTAVSVRWFCRAGTRSFVVVVGALAIAWQKRSFL